MTFENHEMLLKEEVFKKIGKFPYLIVNDPHRILDQKVITGADIITYESEKDYANVRLKSELAKAFQLGPSVFLFRDKSAEQYFTDLYAWFEKVDVGEKILEYLSERLNEHISTFKPAQPLIIRIFKEKKMNQLEQLLAKLSLQERPIKVHALRDFSLSILLDQDITGEDYQEKTRKLSFIIFDSQKFDQARALLIDTELGEFVEATFSTNETIQKCLEDPRFRKNTRIFLLARHCVKNFPEERRKLLIPLLFERYEFKEKEEREEVSKLYGTIASELPMLCERISDTEFFQSLNKFVRDYEKQWFSESNTVSEFESTINEYQGFLISEFEHSIGKIRNFVENISAIKIEDLEKLRNVLRKLNSWLVVKSDNKCQREIENLSNLISLANLTILISASNPRSWSEWTKVYETYMLDADKLLSDFKREPAILETSTYKIVTQGYSEVQSRALNDYEMFLLRNYPKWVEGDPSRPKMVTDIADEINSLLRTHAVIFLVVYDSMRVDFWNILKKELEKGFKVTEDRILSVIPSETIFSRRAIFSGSCPKDFDSFDECLLMRRKIRMPACYETGKIEKFDELLKRKEKVRIFVYGVLDEIGHHFKEGLSIALESFKPIAQKHAQYYEKIKSHLSEFGKVAIVIASDHGFIQTSELKQIYLPEHVDWLYSDFHPRFVVFGRKRGEIVAPYQVQDLMAKLEEQNLGYLVKDPKKFKIVKPDGSIEVSYNADEQVVHPLFLLFAKSEIRFFRLGGREPPEFAHGGLSPHETIVPFAVLEPK